MRFLESGASPRVYLVEGADNENQPVPGWFSFLLPPGGSGPPWGVLQPGDTLGMAGFYVTCPRVPANLTGFVEAAGATLEAFIRRKGITNRSASWFVWFADPDASGDAMGLQVLSVTKTGAYFLTDTVSPNVTVRDLVLQISAGAAVTYDAGAGAFAIFAGSGLTLTFGGQSNNVGQVDQNLSVPLAGPQRGCVVGACAVTRWNAFDLISPSVSYYAPGTNGRELEQLRFPLFDGSAIGDGGVSLTVSLDPSTPESPDRTSLAFQGAPALPSYLRTTTGQPVTLTPTANATRIAFANRPATLDGGVAQPGGLTPYPDGPFGVAVPGAPDGAVTAQLVPGLAGTEFLAVSSDGTVLTFEGARPALVAFPLDTAAPATTGGDLLTTGGGGATTAWARITTSGDVAYHAQPQAAPLFAAPLGAPASGAVAVLEPQPTTLWSGATTPAVPVTAYAGAPATASDADVAALEQRAVALTRQRAMTAAARAPRSLRPLRRRVGADRVWSTDRRGFRVGLAGGAWQAVTFASTPPEPGGSTVDLTLEIAQPVVAEALQGEQVFLVATTTVDSAGKPLFAFDGSLYLAGWEATPHLASTWDPAASPDAGTAMMIVKLGSKPISEIARSLDEWTDASTFLPDPAGTQAALVQIIDAALAATDPMAAVGGGPTDDASLFADFVRVVTDSTWTGVLFLNAGLGQAPPIIRGVLSGVPPEDLRWHHAGVSFNRVNADSTLSLAASATFGLVDYASTATPSLSGATYTFWTRWLQALFLNAALASFNCRVALGLQRFFGVPLALASGQPPIIEISGVYQERATGSGGDERTGVYSFITTEAHEFTFDYSASTSLVTAEILETIALSKVQLAPGGATAERITTNFLFWGTLAFGRIVGGASGAGLDVFNFDALPFGGIALAMSSPAQGGPADEWGLSTADATFDLASATLRPGGLVGSLPLDLRSLHYADGGAFGLGDLGYMPLGLPPGNPDQAGAVTAALVYSLDLGRPGTLGGAEPIVASVLTGWTVDGAVMLGITVPGLGGDQALTYEGIAKLFLGSFRLNVVTPATPALGQTPLVTLEIDSCTYELLGARFPQAPMSLTVVIADPGGTGGVLWFSSWPPPSPPTERALVVRVRGG
jgi:hypothetical protein